MASLVKGREMIPEEPDLRHCHLHPPLTTAHAQA
jgi:hypothetical protein